MYNILIDNIEEKKEQFREIHGASGFYGGSDVAAICGLSPFETPLGVWMRKTGKTPPIEENEHMRFGKRMEPVLIQMFYDRVGRAALPINQVWQSTNHAWMIASPDAQIKSQNQLIEFKTHKAYANRYWGPDTASDSAMCQLQWYLAVSGYEGGYCCALIGGDVEKFYFPYFESDKEVQSQLIERVEKFMDLVRADTPPEVSADDSKNISKIIRQTTPAELSDLTATHSELMERYKNATAIHDALKAQWEESEREMKRIKNQFLADSNGAGTILVGKDVVKISHIPGNEYTTKREPYYLINIKLAGE